MSASGAPAIRSERGQRSVRALSRNHQRSLYICPTGRLPPDASGQVKRRLHHCGRRMVGIDMLVLRSDVPQFSEASQIRRCSQPQKERALVSLAWMPAMGRWPPPSRRGRESAEPPLADTASTFTSWSSQAGGLSATMWPLAAGTLPAATQVQEQVYVGAVANLFRFDINPGGRRHAPRKPRPLAGKPQPPP